MNAKLRHFARTWRILAVATAVALATLVVTLGAPATPAAAQAAPAPAERPAINPEAIAALEAMGTYLRSLKVFQVSAAVIDEDVLEDGQKFQYAGVAEAIVQTPNRLRMTTTSERSDRLFLYDGKNVTLYGKRVNYYATAPAPPTIREVVAKLEEEFGISLPMVDLFRWGAPDWKPEGITSALDGGLSEVQGTTCQHYLFRQADLDWQIWIQKGPFPLPRKLVITTRTDEARPQHSLVLTWNLAPAVNEAAFVFDPPPGAGKVVFEKVK